MTAPRGHFLPWAEHHLLMLEAAVTLPRREMLLAFQDISEITGRTYANVQRKALDKAAIENERNRIAHREAILKPRRAVQYG